MKKQLILTATLFALLITSCGKSPEQARKELGQLGIAYNIDNFKRTIQNDDEIAIKLFLQSEIDPSPALCTAINQKDLDLVKKLLRYGADPNYDKTESLWCAAKVNDYEIAKILLDNKANPTISSLKKAIDNGNKKIVELLIDRGAKIDDRQVKSELLLEAIDNNQTEIAKIFLDSGLDPNLKITRYRTSYSFLSRAVRENDPKMVELLLNKKANPNDFDGGKNSQSLILAIDKYTKNKNDNNNIQIVKLLLNAGANPNSIFQRNSKGFDTALSKAIDKKKTEVVKLLLDAGSDPNLQFKDWRGNSIPALKLAVQENDPKMVELLLNKKANPNDFDGTKNSESLIIAIKNKNSQIVKLLLDSGANPNTSIKRNRSSQDVAFNTAFNKLNRGNIQANRKILKLLLDAGANPYISWNDSASRLRRYMGQEFSFICPPVGKIKRFYNWIYGTDIYAYNSPICLAAVHSGLITLQNGGRITIKIIPGQDSYQGSLRNQVRSSSWGKYGVSFIFVK